MFEIIGLTCSHFYVFSVIIFVFFKSVLEDFFLVIYRAYNLQDGDIFKAIEASTEYASKIKAEAGKKDPGKQVLDRAIRDDKGIRAAVWKHCNLLDSMPYPLFTNDLVYGVLSNIVHNADYRAILLSNEAHSDYLQFYKGLAVYFGKPFEQFSAISASAGEALVEKT